MPLAEKFTDWFTKNILLSIRNHGEYNIEEKNIKQVIDLNNLLHLFALIKTYDLGHYNYYVIIY